MSKKRSTSTDSGIVSHKKSKRIKSKSVRLTWKQRAAVVFLYLHKQIANKSKARTSELSGIAESTIRTWLKNSDFVPKWLCFLKDMSAKEALGELNLDIGKFELVLPQDRVDISEYRSLSHSSFVNADHRVFSRAESGYPISGEQKQVSLIGRKSKFQLQRDFLNSTILNLRNKKEIITPEMLKNVIIQKFSSVRDEFHAKYLDASNRNFPTSLRVWIRRSFKPNLKSNRGKKTTKFPKSWREISMSFHKDVQSWIKKHEFDVLVSSSQISLKYQDKKTFFQQDFSVATCKLLVSAELTESKVLLPFFEFLEESNVSNTNSCIIKRKNSFVLTSNAINRDELYIYQTKNFLKLFPGKRIGWILDGRTPLSPLFYQILQQINFDPNFAGFISTIHTPHNLSNIMNVTDVLVISQIRSLSVQPSEEALIRAIEERIICINQQEKFSKSIFKCFGRLGLNPYDTGSEGEFKKYLLSIDVNQARSSLASISTVNFA